MGVFLKAAAIDVSYDWTLAIPNIRDQYLKPWISVTSVVGQNGNLLKQNKKSI
ncbi:MAG: hypothetical protein WCH10_06925 [bacterium]